MTIQKFVVITADSDLLPRLQNAVDRLEDDAFWTDYDGDVISPSVTYRLPFMGKAEGTYQVGRNGDLQILGYTVQKPEVLEDLLNRAWDAATQGAE